MPKRLRSSSLPSFRALVLSSDTPSLLNDKNSILLSSSSSCTISSAASRVSRIRVLPGIPKASEHVSVGSESTDEDSEVESIVVVEEKKKASALPNIMTSKDANPAEAAEQPPGSISCASLSPLGVPTVANTDELLLDTLHLDADLRASILSMDEETRTEVINDILREHHRQQMPPAMSNFMASFQEEASGGSGGRNLLLNLGFPYSLFSHLPVDSGASNDSASGEEGEGEEKTDEDEEADLEHLLNGAEETEADSTLDVEQGDSDEDGNIMARLLRGDLHGSTRGGETRGGNSLLSMLMLIRQVTENQRNAMAQQEALDRLGVDGDIDNLSYEELLDLEERIGKVSKGISEEKAKTLLVPAPNVSAKDGTCTICLDQLLCEVASEGTLRVCKLKRCNHIFHERCIIGWLKESKNCPVCLEEVLCTKEEENNEKVLK